MTTIGIKVTEENTKRMLDIIADREGGMKFKDIATKYWISRGRAREIYYYGKSLQKFGKLPKKISLTNDKKYETL